MTKFFIIIISLLYICGCSLFSDENDITYEIRSSTGIDIKNQPITYPYPIDPTNGMPNKPCCWYSAYDFRDVVLDINQKNKFEKVLINNFLFQNVASGGDVYKCHDINIYKNRILNKAGTKLYVSFMNEVDIATIYVNEAINLANIELKAKAGFLGIEVLGRITSNLKQNIISNNSSNLKFRYFYATTDIGSVKLLASKDKKIKTKLSNCTKKKYVITGIAGYMILNFKSNSSIYKGEWLELAIQTTIQETDPTLFSKLTPSLQKEISIKWANNSNSQSKVFIGYKYSDTGFFPLWYTEDRLTISEDL